MDRTFLRKFLLWTLPGFAISILVSYQVQRTISEFERRKEKQIFTRSTLTIVDAFNNYIYGLQGVKGMYNTTYNHISQEQFKNYAKSIDYFSNFPGALGFGFIRYVSERDLSVYLKKHFKQDPTFSIQRLDSENNFGNYFVIEQIEPIEQNKKALGLDIGSEKRRRAAAEKSILSGEPTLTAKVSLIQGGKSENGFLFLLPIYESIETPKSLEERRKKILGWSYTPIIIERLLKELEKKLDPRIAVYIQDITTAQEEPIIEPVNQIKKENIGSTFSEAVEIGERTWKFTGISDYSYRNPAYTVMTYIIFLLISLINAIGVYSIVRSMSLKQLAEEKGKFATSWQNAVLDGSNYSIISTQPNGVITTFNRAAEKLLGYRAEEMIGKKTPNAIHLPSEVENRAKELSIELREDVSVSFETLVAKAHNTTADINDWTYVRKDKSTFPVRLSVSAMRDEEGKIIGFLEIAEDKTEQKAMEQRIHEQQMQMVQSAKMAALGEMAGGIAHEINNPLAIIMAKAGQLAENSVIEKDEKILLEMKKIEATCARIAKIVKGLRIFSRTSGTDISEVIYLEDPLEDTLSLCTERLKKANVQLKINIEPRIEVQARRVQLAQVFMNLIGNAFDAIQGLPEKWIEIKTEKTEDLVKIYFIDSGKGIPPEIEKKIMNPFFTTKEVGSGTGLGLSISKGIVEDHKGCLKYQIHNGHTAFVVTLPLYKKKAS